MKTENEKLIGMKKYLIEKIKALRQLFVSDIPIPDYYVEMKNIKIVCSNCMKEVSGCSCDEVIKGVHPKIYDLYVSAVLKSEENKTYKMSDPLNFSEPFIPERWTNKLKTNK